MFKDFGAHVEEVSRRLKEASLAAALELGRVVRYVPSAAASKEDIARQIAAEQKIQSGLVCVLSSVEPCMSFQAVPNRETKKLDFKLEQRKCLHLYHYLIHPVFRLHERADSDVVSVSDSDLPERTRMAGAARWMRRDCVTCDRTTVFRGLKIFRRHNG